MTKLKIWHDRYDGESLVGALTEEAVDRDADGDPFIEARLAGVDGFAVEDFTVYLEATNASGIETVLDAARSLARSLRGLDNVIQEANAAGCAASGLSPESFAFELAYARVWPDRAALDYFGTFVNTEWDAHVSRIGDDWVVEPQSQKR